MVVVTDMQKGVESSITEQLPNAEHRMCVRHVLANWSKKFRGLERRNCFWRYARSTFKNELRDNLDYMKKLGENCLDKLLSYNQNRWSKLYFSFTIKCDRVDNNMAECFNSWILAAMHKSIITMFEETRVKIMKRIGQKSEFCSSGIRDVSPMAMKLLGDNTEKSMKCRIE
ncbi:hypothetical protein RND71_035390 [Anisodus tanguticus]|uniref:Protein FAR1-RELATED SEQUENCE n=1 Tax=Anisodus tanguticus TaxID=243964 RepID=A0AAE1R5Q8_9SOLA|nr:hypothetical protein RND71_035390 [Anisodus tanguticus]